MKRAGKTGGEITRYVNDPLRGNGRAHAIARLLRDGKSPRRVAKVIGVPLAEVLEVKAKIT